MSDTLLTEIRAFLDEFDMGPSYFGRVAAGNSELVKRLETGGRVWPETDVKVRAFMLQYRRTGGRRKAA